MPRSVVLKRVRCLVVVLLAVTPWASAGAADRVVENGQFRLVLDDDNSGLPASLQWQGMELLDATRGLGWSFTSFEGRSKIYHDENRHVWAGKDEPRFVTDVGPAKTETLRADGLGPSEEFEHITKVRETRFAAEPTLEAHEKTLRAEGVDRETIFEAIRAASIVAGVAQAIEAGRILDGASV